MYSRLNILVNHWPCLFAVFDAHCIPSLARRMDNCNESISQLIKQLSCPTMPTIGRGAVFRLPTGDYSGNGYDITDPECSKLDIQLMYQSNFIVTYNGVDRKGIVIKDRITGDTGHSIDIPVEWFGLPVAYFTGTHSF